jgi:hypothetical protein
MHDHRSSVYTIKFDNRQHAKKASCQSDRRNSVSGTGHYAPRHERDHIEGRCSPCCMHPCVETSAPNSEKTKWRRCGVVRLTRAADQRVVSSNVKECSDASHFTLWVRREVFVSHPQNLLGVLRLRLRLESLD